MKATAQATHQNVERLEAELAAVRSEQHAALEEHRRLAEQHSETLKMMEELTNSRKKLEHELESIGHDLKSQRQVPLYGVTPQASVLPSLQAGFAGPSAVVYTHTGTLACEHNDDTCALANTRQVLT